MDWYRGYADCHPPCLRRSGTASGDMKYPLRGHPARGGLSFARLQEKADIPFTLTTTLKIGHEGHLVLYP